MLILDFIMLVFITCIIIKHVMVTEKKITLNLRYDIKTSLSLKILINPTKTLSLTAGFVQIVMFASDPSNVFLRNPRADSF